MEAYGMSESTATTIFSDEEHYKYGSCGREMEGVEVKIDHQKKRSDKEGEGEICCRGRHVMLGYLFDEVKTRESIDEDGFFHSGDIGRKDANGMFYITGRIKELIVSAGGEKYPPIPCEDSIKASCPALANVMMVGDKKKYNVILVTLKTRVDSEENPVDILSGEAKLVDPNVKVVSEAKQSHLWDEYIKNGIKKYNDAATSNAHKVQYHIILDQDFSLSGGELTATMKLKRSFCMTKYKDIIDELYSTHQ